MSIINGIKNPLGSDGVPQPDTGPPDMLKYKLAKLSTSSTSSDEHGSDCDSGHASDIQSSIHSDSSNIWGTKFILALNTQGTEHKDVGDPQSVGFLPDGTLVVADTGNNRLQIVTPLGKVQRRIGKNQTQRRGSRERRNSTSLSGVEANIYPQCIVITTEDDIAFTDGKDKCVKVFTEYGTLIDEWGKGFFKEPYGITQASNGQFITTDTSTHQVHIHKCDGTLIKTFGGRGRDGAKFNSPYFVAVGRNDETIIVSDCYNHAVKIFNFDGELLRTIGNKETMKMPYGVAVDPLGNIAICEKDKDSVSLYSADGKYIQAIFKKDDEILQPWGIAIDSTGRIAVTRRVVAYPRRKPPPEAALFQLVSTEDEQTDGALVMIPESPDEGTVVSPQNTEFTFTVKK
ncbi:unnamed protein product [Owenia fusiformis]|uniref:Uncharacterized protein n=1 Tax=Owenia fusiformis TaxID=6347 RepID=A0A8J1Y3P8_OWEFU|nr:unnamed protein product [Owenia fusiformis]